ncbi:MAG TPA: hypothetical protein VGS27_01620 [Candidatus Sulfotelmatobacter sp.]|nr:hypothetical protein [Candidatus Sulfotelmatobacter sp.]
MAKKLAFAMAMIVVVMCPALWLKGAQKPLKPEFHTSDRCFACHNELTTQSGRDISIGLAWRSSIMANASRDPYWQASVRRETIDHPPATADIQDECSVCHMPMIRYQAKLQGKKGEIFKYLPFDAVDKQSDTAEDGVTCSVCHQISKEKLGTRESFSGGFVIEPPLAKNDHPEYGPFQIAPDRQHIMDTSTGGFQPTYAQHIRDSALCGSCHQLYTTARGTDGKKTGYLPEQMPYLEWRHSDYPERYSCQGCHMPEVHEQVKISSVLGVPRTGMHQHIFVGGNFLLQGMLNRYRNQLSVAALPQELTTAAEGTLNFLQSQSADLELRNVEVNSSRLQVEVVVHNRAGHKLPTAYPSRRAWLHLTVTNRNGTTIFESGKLNPDGSILGNDNDDDPLRYEPHYRQITNPDQVEIYESILKDPEGRVTTGLISAVGYLKDNRVLPAGFDKQTAEKDIAVVGDAADDPNFTAGSDLVRYSISTGLAEGPFHIEVELLYQPIGFRWAHNLGFYKAAETQRFVGYYESMSSQTTAVLARAEATR